MSSQTKDEAAQELTKMIHQYANGVATIEEVEAARDAYAQAAVDAALDVVRRTQIVMEANHDEGQYEEEADTLGLLEALANCDDGWMELKWNTPKGWVGIRIMTEPAKLQVRYYYNGWQNATRAEAEALLGKEKK